MQRGTAMGIDFTSLGLDDLFELDPERLVELLKRPVSGTYRNVEPAGFGRMLELRVDVDGRRPQHRISGDLYTHLTFCGIPLTLYTGSFVVDEISETGDGSETRLSGPVHYYADPDNTADSIEVRIPRVGHFESTPAACVHWYTYGSVAHQYLCEKVSAYFRTARLEVDRFQGTVFPPALDPNIDPSPGELPSSVDVRGTFLRSGVDLTVAHDDVLSDADGADPGSNWSEAELHDLMEERFDAFANTLQWNLYAVVVPRFGDPTYNASYYGTMFDWGGWQAGDSFLRQGCAIAEDAIRGREVDDLYETSDGKDRLILQTLIHEIGHAFNLPHAWQRSAAPDAASESFMNYPWGYTGGGGGERSFWSSFRWEFDDVELLWMRHADRNAVIFGGRDWIGSNLSADLRPAFEMPGPPLELEIQAPDVFDIGVPVRFGLKLTNTSAAPVEVVDRLDPEDGLLHVVMQRPNGDIVSFVPPVRRLMTPPAQFALAPGESTYASVGLSFGAKGHQFTEPGEYLIRVYFPCFPIGFVATTARRIRIAHPLARRSEELVHLLTSPEAAMFMYYGGTRRHADVTQRLIEATERYADTDPVAVRHIAAALGRDAARTAKRVVEKQGRRVVVADPPDAGTAVRRLETAMAPLPDAYGPGSAFDALTEARLVATLADSYAELERVNEATAALEAALDRLRRRDLPAGEIEALERRLRRMRAAS